MKNAISILIILFSVGLFGCASMQSDWDKAQRQDLSYSYKHFLKKYPNSQYAAAARKNLERATWDETRRFDKPEFYQRYLSEFPNGPHVSEALASIEPAAFKQAKAMEKIEAMEKFLSDYPQTRFRNEAESWIAQLKRLGEIESKFNKQFEVRLSHKDYNGMEALVNEYRQYSFVKKTIPKLEDSIVNEIRAGKEKQRYQIPISINGAFRVRTTFRASYSGGKDGTLSAGPSFPGDTSGLIALFNNNNIGDGSIVRFGRSNVGMKIQGYIFRGAGDEFNLLSFAIVKNVGYVYLRGKGSVQGPDNKVTVLGQ
jgi:outer membrane protein assembly factor BamD (BamD/ComL family)